MTKVRFISKFHFIYHKLLPLRPGFYHILFDFKSTEKNHKNFYLDEDPGLNGFRLCYDITHFLFHFCIAIHDSYAINVWKRISQKLYGKDQNDQMNIKEQVILRFLH